MPAGTGVCVVNTVRARTTCSACSGSTAVLDQPAHALEREEARVALVHVEDGGLDAAGGERLDAADAEQDLLAQAVLAVAAVEAVGDRALGRARSRRTSVSSRSSGTRPTSTRQRAACSVAPGERRRDLHARAVGAEPA